MAARLKRDPGVVRLQAVGLKEAPIARNRCEREGPVGLLQGLSRGDRQGKHPPAKRMHSFGR